MVLMNRRYDVLRQNGAADRLLLQAVADPSALVPPLNAVTSLFDPRLFRPHVVDWNRSARDLLARIHREALHQDHDGALHELIEQCLSFPDVPAEWRHPDFDLGTEPTFTIRLKTPRVEMAFLTTVTVFSAPQNVTLDELQIESYFPLDEQTDAICHRLAG